MTDHPITPPPELVEQWADEAGKGWRGNGTYEQDIATQAARWGSDQELEACLLWVGDGRRENLSQVIALRTARRPKPPSLKEQALDILKYPKDFWSEDEVDTIRRALEQLND